jgi:hypothetical protein
MISFAHRFGGYASAGNPLLAKCSQNDGGKRRFNRLMNVS